MRVHMEGSMKKRMFHVCSIAVSIAVLLLLATVFFRRDEGFLKNYDFYETDEEYDVLYFGSSLAVMGILPMEIWNEYGITSFNLANNGQKLNGDYWVLKNALEQKKPKLVVLDVYTVMVDEEWDESTIHYLHDSIDPMPFSEIKRDAINDLLPKDMRQEFLWPFSIYHNRWEDIDETFFVKKVSCQKGSYENADYERPTVLPQPEMFTLDPALEDPTETVGKEYLRKAIELCREYDVPVLLTATPFYGVEEEMRYINSVYGIAEEYGVQFLNGMEASVVDTGCDFLDSKHMNSSGARKWSSYLGAYMKEHYPLADHRADEAYQSWHEDYDNYRIYVEEQLNGTEDLYPYLMLLQDAGFSSYIRVSENSAVSGDELFWRLLGNAGAMERPETLQEGFSVWMNHCEEGVSFSAEEQAGLPEDVSADIEILVFDSRTGELVSHTGFSSANERERVYAAETE